MVFFAYILILVLNYLLWIIIVGANYLFVLSFHLSLSCLILLDNYGVAARNRIGSLSGKWTEQISANSPSHFIVHLYILSEQIQIQLILKLVLWLIHSVLETTHGALWKDASGFWSNYSPRLRHTTSARMFLTSVQRKVITFGSQSALFVSTSLPGASDDRYRYGALPMHWPPLQAPCITLRSRARFYARRTERPACLFLASVMALCESVTSYARVHWSMLFIVNITEINARGLFDIKQLMETCTRVYAPHTTLSSQR